MAFLDFITKRNAQQSVAKTAQEPKPENAKQFHARRDAEEKANLKPRESLSAGQAGRVEDAKARFENFIEKAQGQSPMASPSGGASPEALRQNQSGQDRVAPAGSPTGDHVGKAHEKSAPASEAKAPAKQPTVPRPAPSWER